MAEPDPMSPSDRLDELARLLTEVVEDVRAIAAQIREQGRDSDQP